VKTSFTFNRTFSATIPFGAVALISLVSSSGCKFVGTTVFGGMVAATLLSLIVVPMMYFSIQTIAEKITSSKKVAEPIENTGNTE